ncbi:MAG: DUF86 domain-containing protein [Thermodesulfobacteriaceae bacterium]|nr:DUF86 domain-containing protein [Thermodesulfobacteriaceae bacterium]MCX8042110.1 DUF86 domain-containing protein [Thermodesulfobacteriaceae bacterium]MDW8136206.1 DUF86 domain-containing protein [Thermodesulfobacterium sp.]
MVSEKVIRKLLERLETSLKRLNSKKEISKEVFINNWEVHGAIIREFQIAIQSMIDIGTHLIAEMGWETPDYYKEVANILQKHGVISKEYAEIFKKIIAFRNILVHEYLELDLELVYDRLKNLEDIKRFANFVEEFLERTST